MNKNEYRKPVISLTGVSKDYATKTSRFKALNEINLEIMRGEFISITGRSGSGKSTLLNMISGIDIPSSGGIEILGTPVNALNEGKRAAFRGRHIGIVFQFFQLMPNISVADNIMLPMDFCGYLPQKKRRERAIMLLDSVGIADQAAKLPGELSGGQQQRVAIARAMANSPEILVADEPTGNLDSDSAAGIFMMLENLAKSGTTVVMVTHERSRNASVDRTVTIHDGYILEDESLMKEAVNV